MTKMRGIQVDERIFFRQLTQSVFQFHPAHLQQVQALDLPLGQPLFLPKFQLHRTYLPSKKCCAG